IERSLFLVFFAIFIGIAALVAAVDGPSVEGQRKGMVMAMVLAFPVFIFWSGWASRMLVLLLHARNLRIPGLPAEVRNALLAMATITIVVPAVACIGFGGQPGVVLAVLVLAAAGGMLMAMLPRGIAPLIGFGPLVLSQVARLRPDGLPLSTVLPVTAVALLLIVAWRGRSLARAPVVGDTADWSQPMLFATAARGSFWVGRDLLDSRSQLASLPGWARHVSSVDKLGPRAPLRSLRTLLGGAFAPLQGRQWLLSTVGWSVGLVFVWFYVGRDPGAGASLLSFSLVGGAALLLAPLPMRLQALQRDHAGELCEAALLPGWGDATATHALMLRAVMRVYAAWLLGFTAWMLGVALYFHRVAALPLLLMAIVGIAVVGTAAWMRPLSGKPWMPGVWSGALAIIVGAILVAVTMIDLSADHSMVKAMVAWAVMIVAAGVSAGRSLRRYRARPHPFLME
ncbi:MAG: hypothetical protein ABIR05_08620, partial [Luteimonas sp.]